MSDKATKHCKKPYCGNTVLKKHKIAIFTIFLQFNRVYMRVQNCGSLWHLWMYSSTSDEAVKKYRVIYRGARADVRTLSAKLCNTWARAWFLPARFRERSQRTSTVVRSIDSRDHENTF